ncbi:MAG: ABC transporter ATP-binding protein [Planctomycetes bacterium]|nr:ABC transporter ATP-binding protein [Planctomycetota bacterium]
MSSELVSSDLPDDVAIRIRGLSKSYTIHGRRLPGISLRDDILRCISLQWMRKAPTHPFVALADVDLDVRPGEVVGILGGNGAGKSTLLKLLCRITRPSTGRIIYRGRIASILEVGTGFHPDLSGRENIYLNGAILGMRRAEINAVFDDIVAFAEIGEFLDEPVKRYSSGMFVRLAFSIAAHLDPEVLVVDEVLAVGDERFRSKCLERVRSHFARRAVLFVSHDEAMVRAICTRAIVLDHGRKLFDGDVQAALGLYHSLSRPACASTS